MGEEDGVEWSFVGAVAVICLACLAFLVSVAYYCWLYEALKPLTRFLHSKGNTIESPDNRDHEKECHEKECHVTLQPQTAAPAKLSPRHKSTRLSPAERSRGSTSRHSPAEVKRSRGTRHSRQTRQRAVNKALHALKSGSYHGNRTISSDPEVPCKPEKSDAVRAYLKEASEESEEGNVECSEEDTGYSGDMTETEGDRSGGQGEHSMSENCKQQPTAPPSFRSQKWSKMKALNSAALAKTSTVQAFQSALTHKIGRSTRAVAPQHLTKHRMYPYVRKVIELNNVDRKGPSKTNQDKTESIFEILLALRKNGDLGMNLVETPVSRALPSNHYEKAALTTQEAADLSSSSRSDAIKSSSDSPSDSDNASLDKSAAKPLPADASNEPGKRAISPLDPSLPVFGGSHTTADVSVRRVDGLFYSSSSTGSNVSENIFTTQGEHNSAAQPHHQPGPEGEYNSVTITTHVRTCAQPLPSEKGSPFSFPEVDTSSFESTSLPSVSSSSSTLDLSSSEPDNQGQLKYFAL